MSIPDKDTIKRHFSIIVRYNLFACNKAELGDMIDFPSIRTNSIQKMPIDKMTMAYTVFHNEVFNLYYEKAELSFVMDEFTDAVEFYKNNELKRMTAFSAENRYERTLAERTLTKPKAVLIFKKIDNILARLIKEGGKGTNDQCQVLKTLKGNNWMSM